MANCVVCSYPTIHVKDGNVVNMDVKANEKVKEVLEKQKAEIEAGETPVGCYICPECGHCTWLET